MRYWSTSHKRWQTLIVDAYALAGTAGDRRRKDFTMEEMAAVQRLLFHQEDNLSGKATYWQYPNWRRKTRVTVGELAPLARNFGGAVKRSGGAPV